MVLKDLLELGPAPTRQRHVLSQLLGINNDAGSLCRRDLEALLRVELWILKCGQALDLIQVGR